MYSVIFIIFLLDIIQPPNKRAKTAPAGKMALSDHHKPPSSNAGDLEPLSRPRRSKKASQPNYSQDISSVDEDDPRKYFCKTRGLGLINIVSAPSSIRYKAKAPTISSS